MAREVATVDGADATDHPVGRSACNQVVDAAPTTLGGDDHGTVFDEACVVDKVGNVFASGAPSNRTTSLHGVGPRRIETNVVPLEYLGEIGANVGEIYNRLGHINTGGHFDQIDHQQTLASEHG